MANTTQDALARAIGPCGFSEVDTARIDEAVKIEGTSKWAWPRVGGGWVVRFNDRHGDCWNVAMPAWWSPESRFAWIHADRVLCPNPKDCSSDTRRITADLATGQEVPA